MIADIRGIMAQMHLAPQFEVFPNVETGEATKNDPDGEANWSAHPLTDHSPDEP
jgi:hypothetical protein